MRAETETRPVREELASAALMGSAAAAGIAGTAYLVARASSHAHRANVIALVIYGLSMIVAFLASALYHGIQDPRLKDLARHVDHCTIFLFIAGTYTAVTALALPEDQGLLLQGIVWALAVAGIALRIRSGLGFLRRAIPIYLVMGWLFLGWSAPLYRAVGAAPLALMFLGGACYTGGLAFYRWHRLPFANTLWHAAVVAGSACFFSAITRFPQL